MKKKLMFQRTKCVYIPHTSLDVPDRLQSRSRYLLLLTSFLILFLHYLPWDSTCRIRTGPLLKHVLSKLLVYLCVIHPITRCSLIHTFGLHSSSPSVYVTLVHTFSRYILVHHPFT